MTSTVPPSFPLDLEREIFQTSAAEHPEMMPTLVLVAHRVLQWIEPLLYRTLLLMQDSPRDKTALLLAIQRTPAKFTKYVQNLLVWPGEASPHGECAMLLISLCSGISRLALLYPKPTMLPALDNMRLDHLFVSLSFLFGHTSDPGEINFDRPLFQALTHLGLLDDRLIDGLPFAQLPALTHLCVTEQHDLQPLLSILKKCEKLCVLVNMYGSQVDFEQDFVDDPRLVLMTLSPEEYMTDWVAGTKGGQDFWARAEMFVVKQRREIKPVFRCWIMEEDLID
ncbi:hypothetical protein C8J57DRAFT_1345374 [Mycena rebaudengoi]|nr:hypothetical protein C8J57DRAFT_1345374 [Mycena rebaudengoi]